MLPLLATALCLISGAVSKPETPAATHMATLYENSLQRIVHPEEEYSETSPDLSERYLNDQGYAGSHPSPVRSYSSFEPEDDIYSYQKTPFRPPGAVSHLRSSSVAHKYNPYHTLPYEKKRKDNPSHSSYHKPSVNSYKSVMESSPNGYSPFAGYQDHGWYNTMVGGYDDFGYNIDGSESSYKGPKKVYKSYKKTEHSPDSSSKFTPYDDYEDEDRYSRHQPSGKGGERRHRHKEDYGYAEEGYSHRRPRPYRRKNKYERPYHQHSESAPQSGGFWSSVFGSLKKHMPSYDWSPSKDKYKVSGYPEDKLPPKPSYGKGWSSGRPPKRPKDVSGETDFYEELDEYRGSRERDRGHGDRYLYHSSENKKRYPKKRLKHYRRPHSHHKISEHSHKRGTRHRRPLQKHRRFRKHRRDHHLD